MTSEIHPHVVSYQRRFFTLVSSAQPQKAPSNIPQYILPLGSTYPTAFDVQIH